MDHRDVRTTLILTGCSIGLTCLALALLLAPPPAQAGAPATRAEPQATASALPQDGDLTLGGAAGDVLIGLTLRPGTPGTNTVLLFVRPPQSANPSATVPTELAVNGRAVALRVCGAMCWSGNLELAGNEQLAVRVKAPQEAVATFTLPSLPAANGAALLDQVQLRTRALQTYRVEETLGPAAPPVQATYAFQAPDRMRLELANGAQTVWIDHTRYRRSGPDSAWQVETLAFSLQVPQFAWQDPQIKHYIAPRLLGTERVDDVDTQSLSFFTQAGQHPVWFQLWVDGDGLVHRAQMRAPGHFMDHRYFDFNAPFTIEAPPSRS